MTEETDIPKRPNAGYKLSKPDLPPGSIDKENLTFYYNREERLAKAPQDVRDLYDKKKRPGFSLIRPLIADKSRALIFFSIVVLCIVIIMLALLGYFDRAYTLDGNKLEFSGIIFDDNTLIELKKTVRDKNNAYSGSFEIVVSPVVKAGEEYPTYYYSNFFTLSGEEIYRFVVPFDSPELLLVIQTEKNIRSIRITPE